MELAIGGAVKYTEYEQNKGVLIMKRVICAVVALVMVLALAACGGGNGPKDTVKTFCEGLKAYDMKKVSACMSGDVKADDMDLSNSGMPESISKMFKEWASKLSYKIGSVREEGGKAYVDVTFSYTDASAVFGAAIKDFFAKAMAAAMSGQMDQEAMSKLLQECLETAAHRDDFRLEDKQYPGRGCDSCHVQYPFEHKEPVRAVGKPFKFQWKQIIRKTEGT